MPDMIDQAIRDRARQMQPGLKVDPGVTITREIRDAVLEGRFQAYREEFWRTVNSYREP